MTFSDHFYTQPVTNNVHRINYIVSQTSLRCRPIGRITRHTHPSVCPYVCTARARNSKTKKRRKKQQNWRKRSSAHEWVKCLFSWKDQRSRSQDNAAQTPLNGHRLRTRATDTTNGRALNNSTTKLPHRNARAQHLGMSTVKMLGIGMWQIFVRWWWICCELVRWWCSLVVFVAGVRVVEFGS